MMILVPGNIPGTKNSIRSGPSPVAGHGKLHFHVSEVWLGLFPGQYPRTLVIGRPTSRLNGDFPTSRPYTEAGETR
jgi:hypothetical protein